MILCFLDFEQAKVRYINAQKLYNSILNEQEELIVEYLPRTVRYDQEKVKGGAIGDAFSSYLVRKEQLKLDERLEEVEILLDIRGRQYQRELEQLKQSNEIMDKIYYRRRVLKIKVSIIAEELIYSESQIYRYLYAIDEKLKQARLEGILDYEVRQ